MTRVKPKRGHSKNRTQVRDEKHGRFERRKDGTGCVPGLIREFLLSLFDEQCQRNRGRIPYWCQVA